MAYNMLLEIQEQPEVIKRLVLSLGDQDLQKASKIIEACRQDAGKVFLVGNGSSYHSCIYGQYLFSLHNNLSVSLYDTGEFDSFDQLLDQKSVVILVSQSGETGDAIRMIQKIKDRKSKIVLITNGVDSTLAKNSDLVLDLKAGQTKAVPSTKGYLAELIVMALLSDILAGKKDFIYQAEAIIEKIEKEIHANHYLMSSLADRLQFAETIFVLGHSVGLGNAYETALKIKECSHIEAEGYSGLEFRHGPSSVVSEGMPVIVFMADYACEEDLQTVLAEIKQSGAYIIGVGPNDSRFFDYHIVVQQDDFYSPIVSIVPLQILAYELALLHGINPDTPSGVQKVVG